jgi:hypothetical protein
VVQSNLCRPNSREINLSFGFRPATTNGLTNDQRGFKVEMDHMIADARNRDSVYNAGVFQWSGDKLPNFDFVSLSPQPGVDGIYYDGLGINNSAANFLLKRNGAALDNIWKETGCRLRLPDKSYPKEDPREIGFCGVKAAIEKAKTLIIKKISESEKGAVVPVSQHVCGNCEPLF